MATQTRNNRIDPQGVLANQDAEQAVLGSILIDANALLLARKHLRPEDFWHPDHGAIFSAMCAMYDESHTVDVITLANYLEMHGGKAAGAQLTNLVLQTPTSVYVESYAQVVRELATRRQLLGYSAKVAALASNEDMDGSAVLGQVMTDLREVLERERTAMQHVSTAMDDLEADLTDLVAHPGQMRGLPSSIPTLNHLVGGFEPGVCVIGGRPSHGKTAFALQEMALLATRGHPVAMFSLETTTRAVARRLACKWAKVPYTHAKTGQLSDVELNNLYMAMAQIMSLPMYLSYNPAPTTAEIYAEASRLKMQHGLKAIFIDFIQLIRPPKASNANEALAAVSREIKVMALELDVVVFALSQLSRAVDRRDGHRPKLSDLRDSGAIEQDADYVLFVHNEEKVLRENGAEDVDIPEDVRGRAFLLLDKQKDGPTGQAAPMFIPEYGEFREVAL